MTLQATVEWIQDQTGALSGIRTAPDFPLEQVGAFPFVVAYMGGGTFEKGEAGGIVERHDFIIELHIARKDLPRDIEKAVAYVDSIPAAIMADSTLGGTVLQFESIVYEFAPEMFWDAVKTIGFRFTVTGAEIYGSC